MPVGPLGPTVPPALNLIMMNHLQVMKLMFEKNIALKTFLDFVGQRS